MLTAVVMAAVVILVACGSDSKNGRKKNSADNSDENLTLYYANSTWTDLFPEVFTRDQLVTTENLIDTVMNALMDRRRSILCSTLTGRPLTHMRWC